MSYTFEQLKEDVRKEAEALKIHATVEEREKLDISKLKPNSTSFCIYGQMTGDCDSRRASHLIKNCTKIYIEAGSAIDHMELNAVFADFRWSPIEFYILQKEARNANLIAFLRGETETLTL